MHTSENTLNAMHIFGKQLAKLFLELFEFKKESFKMICFFSFSFEQLQYCAKVWARFVLLAKF